MAFSGDGIKHALSVAIITTIVAGGLTYSALFFEGASSVPTENKELIKKEQEINLIYNAKKDSLKNWYKSEINSLKKHYSTKKNLENLSK